MLVFRKGAWMTVDTSFLADPGLSDGQRRIGAAVAATHLARGRSTAAAAAIAVAAAEKAVYAAAYPGLDFCEAPSPSQNRIAGKQHHAPQHKKE
jgi:hypothetical protein